MHEMVEKLLAEVSPGQPCGPDLSNDPSYDALEILLKGKPEVEIGAVVKPAEPPDWMELRKQSMEYLGKSKHLRVAIMLCGSLLKTGGAAGFRDGVQYVRALLERYWPTLHPQLDPEDNNDPERRLNMLRALTLERGAMAAGWLTIVDYLYGAEVCRPRGLPPITYDQIIAARKNTADSTAGSKLDAAIRSTGGDVAAAQHQAIKESLEAIQGIDQFLTNALGAGKTISFEILENALKELLGILAPFLSGGQSAPGGAAAAEAVSAPGAAMASPDAAVAITVRGSIKSRDDVVTVIDSICEYYAQVEPGSPLPYLLRRVQKMVKMDFVQVVQELNIATLDTLRPSMGSALDTDKPPEDAASEAPSA